MSGACEGVKKPSSKYRQRFFFCLAGWMSLRFLFSFKREKWKRRIFHSSVHLAIATRLFIWQSLVCLQFSQNEKQVGKCVFRCRNSPVQLAIVVITKLVATGRPSLGTLEQIVNTRGCFMFRFFCSAIQSDAINYPNSSTVLYARKRIITNDSGIALTFRCMRYVCIMGNGAATKNQNARNDSFLRIRRWTKKFVYAKFPIRSVCTGSIWTVYLGMNMKRGFFWNIVAHLQTWPLTCLQLNNVFIAVKWHLREIFYLDFL